MEIEPGVTRDGSPVAVYLALPPEPEFSPVLDAIPQKACVLDLGCGVGRLANVLARRRHQVTGVDESPAMLAHLDADVEVVEARIEALDLGRRFDVVVLASNMANVADAAIRRAFLQSAVRHVAPGGQVFIQHYDPEWILDVRESDGRIGDVGVTFRVLRRRGYEFDGEVTFRLGDASWRQTFTGTVLDDEMLDHELALVGLRRTKRLSPGWLAASLDEAARQRIEAAE